MTSYQTVMVWDLKAFESSAGIIRGITDEVNSLSWSSGGKLASGEGDGTVIVWDLKSGEPAFRLYQGNYPIWTMAWSPDGRLASGSQDGTVIIWDTITGESITLNTEAGSVYSVAFSPKGQYLAAGLENDSVTIWNSQTGQQLKTLPHTSSVNSVAWSADGRLASGSENGTILIWDWKTDPPTSRPLHTNTVPVKSVAWSADGHLASGANNGEVIVWDLKTGRLEQVLKQHIGKVTSVVWSLDGHYLVSGSEDGFVIVWDVKAGASKFKIQELTTGGVNSVAWSPNGQLAAGLANQTIKITRADLISQNFCETIFRNMTLHEWLIYQGPVYTYQPACSNLQSPILDPVRNSLNENLKTDLKLTLFPWGEYVTKNNLLLISFLDLMTWKGRVKVLFLVLVFLVVVVIGLRLLSKSAIRVWSRIRK